LERSRHNSDRVVITGLGTVCPLGLSTAETWESLLSGRSAVRSVEDFSTEGFPSRIAAQVRGFDATNFLDRKEVRRMGRFTQLAMGALHEAVAQSGLKLEAEDPTRVGLQIGTAIGGIAAIEEQALILHAEGPRRLNPTMAPTVIVSAASCYVAVLLGIKGPTNSPAAACATGVVALGDSLRWLQRGDVDVVLAGGTDSAISPLALASFGRLGALSGRNDDPEHACRPFDVDRDGTVLGEGAAVMVLETEAHARKRGAPILAELAGFGFTEDAFHITAPEPDGSGAARAMALALADAGIGPDEVDYIVPHATGTPLNDTSETLAIQRVFGERAARIPLSSNKGGMGHTLGAAGAISAVVGVECIQQGLVPPTANLMRPDPACPLDHVFPEKRALRVDTVLINAFGFGGQNGCLVLKSWR